MKLEISSQHYITEGSQRLLYKHPENQDLCIKIPKEDSNQRYVGREIKYTHKYQKKLKWLPAYHGTIETTLGKGYIFDLVTNYDGSVAQSVQSLGGQKSLEGLKEKVEELYQVYLNQGIVVSDMHSGNLVAKKITETEYELWIVDGIGNSDFLKVCDISKYFLKKKLIRKFGRLTQSLGLDLKFD